MQQVSCKELVDAYVEWLRSKIAFAHIEDVCEITTPFLDRHNDYMQIYVKPVNGSYRLTDDGYTLNDLSTSGCDVTSSRRRSLLTTILNGFGVRLEGDELVVEARPQVFPQKTHALLQAMLAVNDMFVMAKTQVASLFLEDVEAFLRLSNVRFVSNIQFTGRSGFVHNFDFVIPASASNPERILRAINHPDRNSVTAFLFSWNDTREVRSEGSIAYAVLNDTDRPISPEVIGALRQYGTQFIPWKRRDEYIEQLAA
jgi:hypothetical protein